MIPAVGRDGFPAGAANAPPPCVSHAPTAPNPGREAIEDTP